MIAKRKTETWFPQVMFVAAGFLIAGSAYVWLAVPAAAGALALAVLGAFAIGAGAGANLNPQRKSIRKTAPAPRAASAVSAAREKIVSISRRRKSPGQDVIESQSIALERIVRSGLSREEALQVLEA